jgi:chorismate mutase
MKTIDHHSEIKRIDKEICRLIEERIRLISQPSGKRRSSREPVREGSIPEEEQYFPDI